MANFGFGMFKRPENSLPEVALKRIELAKRMRLTQLDLSECELKEIPDQLFELTWLEELNLGDRESNIFEKTFFFEKTGLKNNKIAKLSIKFKSLINLKVLSLSFNPISDANMVENCVKLEKLDLSGCKMISVNFIEKLPELTDLNLSYNRDIYFNELQPLRKLKELNLIQNQITDIGFIKSFPGLKYLNLSSNIIIDISPIEGLVSLIFINLSQNKITDISKLTSLTSLERIDLSYNKIIDILSLGKLTKLKVVFLSGNEIVNITPLQNLPALSDIYLNSNCIVDITPLGQSEVLSTIDLSNNKIRDLAPLKNLIQKGLSVNINRSGFIGLILYENPLSSPPPEVINQGKGAIYNYFKEREQSGSEYMYEAKLLLVGEGGAGKTSLARKIKDSNAPLPSENDTTKGISIEPFSFRMNNGQNFQINLWDFGGQEIYYSTHQFFLTKRSLYILVDDTRKDDKNVHDASFNYWLQVVALFGNDSPLLIIQNEKSDRSKELDMKGIKGQFDFVKDRFSSNLLTGRGLDNIRDAIFHYIRQLPHIGQKLPLIWIVIRKELQSLAKTKDFIFIEEYLSICANNGLKEEERALFLSSYLHDLGIFLHFQQDLILQNLIILNNQWATEAVYKVLDNAEIKEKYGHFNKIDLQRIWADTRYNYRYNELLALMMKFELCYEVKNKGGENWLAPQLLPVEAPEMKWDLSNALFITLVYDFIPKGLISRLIVRMNHYIKEPLLSWRTGVVLERQHTKALVIEAYNKREINVQVVGTYPKDLMSIVMDEFEQMHAYFENLKVERRIACSCRKCVSNKKNGYFNYDKLMEAKENNVIEVQCPESFLMVNVETLLGEMFTDIDYESDKRENVKNNLNVFLSYSHKDEQLKEELDTALSALKLGGKITTWNDRKISGGEDWDESINAQLNKADVILLLISADFMASKYVWEHEITKAIERHKNNQAKVIPIFVRSCDFKGMPFEKLQGFPRDAKPIKSFIDIDEALTQVAQGIRESLESWARK